MARVDQEKFYENAIKRYGKVAKGVAWIDEVRQKKRFNTILKQVESIKEVTLVDAGCGFGDLYLFMKERSLLPKKYIGIDALDIMVEEAKSRTGQTILKCDLLKDKLPEADWYVASGSLNLLTRFETLLAIKRCFDVSNKGVVFNLLKGKDISKTYNYWMPEEISKSCRKLGNVKIIEGYLDGDFTVVIRRVY